MTPVSNTITGTADKKLRRHLDRLSTHTMPEWQLKPGYPYFRDRVATLYGL
jgi:hypothetical protein